MTRPRSPRLVLSPLLLLVALITVLTAETVSASAAHGSETRVRAIPTATADAVGQPSSETAGSVGCLRPSPAGLVSGSCVATNKVSAYDVGTYDDLVAASAKGDGLDIHHVMQDHAAQQLIPGATRGNGPAIALPQAEHRLIPNLKGDVSLTPRQVLARDAWNLRNYTNAPNNAIQDLIALNKATYPGALAR